MERRALIASIAAHEQIACETMRSARKYEAESKLLIRSATAPRRVSLLTLLAKNAWLSQFASEVLTFMGMIRES